MAAPVSTGYDSVPAHDHRVQLSGVTWADYERLLEIRGEVVWTSGGLDKLEVYRRLGVGEVWIGSRGQIQVYRLDGERYLLAEASGVLSGIDLRQLERYLELSTTSRAMREYRAALKA